MLKLYDSVSFYVNERTKTIKVKGIIIEFWESRICIYDPGIKTFYSINPNRIIRTVLCA